MSSFSLIGLVDFSGKDDRENCRTYAVALWEWPTVLDGESMRIWYCWE